MDKANFKLVKLARESRGITQKQLVEVIPNLSASNYSKFEKGMGNISDEAVKAISVQLNYPLGFFYKSEVKKQISSFYYKRRPL